MQPHLLHEYNSDSQIPVHALRGGLVTWGRPRPNGREDVRPGTHWPRGPPHRASVPWAGEARVGAGAVAGVGLNAGAVGAGVGANPLVAGPEKGGLSDLPRSMLTISAACSLSRLEGCRASEG